MRQSALSIRPIIQSIITIATTSQQTAPNHRPTFVFGSVDEILIFLEMNQDRYFISISISISSTHKTTQQVFFHERFQHIRKTHQCYGRPTTLQQEEQQPQQ
jgi:hypothetical protein